MINDIYILSIDQGTTGTTTILYNQSGRIVGKAYREFSQIYPKPGWVEHDPIEIWQTVVDSVEELCISYPGNIAAVGITNQRETTVLWDRTTGTPIYNAIVWQCRRPAESCEILREHEALFRSKTGLPVDAYFSGTKIKWILENVKKYRLDHILFGTIDSWLVWKLTGGKVHATDYTNASRTLLFDIKEKKWDQELCRLLDVPFSILPEVKKSIDNYGVVESIPLLAGIPILSVVGDQQAALFGQMCFTKGQIKNSYGTGCFVLMNVGPKPVVSKSGLLSTIAWGINDSVEYALEGSVFIAGAVVQWLRDELKVIADAAESEQLARSVPDNGGVYFVPAFVGLGAPHWDMYARGTVVGLTRGSNRGHIARAALESICYQTRDVIECMEADSGRTLDELKVDGGAIANDFLMQFQSDILGVPVSRPEVAETTALGAAYLAGLAVGYWKSLDDIASNWREQARFAPSMEEKERERLYAQWKRAVECAKGWAKE